MHPVLGQVGPVTILTHDAFTVLALVVGLSLYYRELARRGWLETRIVWISLAAVIGGAIGARTITAWEHIEYYTALEGVPLSVAIENSGKSLIGALAGGYLATVLAKRAFGYTRSTGDCYVLAIAVATAIGRVGCFLSELPLGTPTTLPWGVSVSAEAAAAFARCPGCELPMHPSMLYEIAFNLVAVALIVRFRDRVPVVGDTLKLYLLAAGDLPLLRRVRPRERAAGPGPDRSAVGADPARRLARRPLRPPMVAGRVAGPRPARGAGARGERRSHRWPRSREDRTMTEPPEERKPKDPATWIGATSDRVGSLSEYFLAGAERYTPEALRQAASEAGYSPAEIDEAYGRATKRQRDEELSRPLRRRARWIVLAAYGLVYAVFVVAFLGVRQHVWSRDDRAHHPDRRARHGAPDLDRLGPRPASVRRAAARTGCSRCSSLPLVLLVAVAGLCIATTQPFN